MDRELIGEPKAGLALQIRQGPTALSITGRPDPLLLFVVLGSALALGVVGTVSVAPREGLVTFLAFSFLFLPLICALAFNALRIKTRCVLDRERGTLDIEEQSYTRRILEVYALSEVVGVRVRRLPPGLHAGGSWVHGALLDLGSADYLAVAGSNEATVAQDAWRIARFLGVPLEGPEPDEAAGAPAGARVVVATGLIYALPVALAILILYLVTDRLPGNEPPIVALLGAVVVSQIAAMLAFAYYRRRSQPAG